MCNNKVKCSYQSSPRTMLNCSFIERLKEVPMYSHSKNMLPPPVWAGLLWSTKNGAPHGGDCAPFATPSPVWASLCDSQRLVHLMGVIASPLKPPPSVGQPFVAHKDWCISWACFPSFGGLGVFVLLFLGMPFMKHHSCNTKSK